METGTETTRRIEIAAEPDEVWEALTTDEGRERWLEDDPDREIVVESEDAPEPAGLVVVARRRGRRRGSSSWSSRSRPAPGWW